MISEVDVRSQLGCSDHREIRFNLEWKVNRDNNLILVPDFRRVNYEGLGRHLEEVNWESLELGGDDPGNSVGRNYNNLVQTISEG